MANTHNPPQRPVGLGVTLIWVLMAIIGGMALLLFAHDSFAIDVRPAPLQGERGDFSNHTNTGANVGIRSNVGVNLNAGSDARANLRNDSTGTMRNDNSARVNSRVDSRVGGSDNPPNPVLKDAPIGEDITPDNVTTNVNTGGRGQTTLGADLGLGR